MGGGAGDLCAGHFGPGVIRGRLGTISPFAFIVFLLSLFLSRLCPVFVSSWLCLFKWHVSFLTESFQVEVFEVEVFEVEVCEVEAFELEPFQAEVFEVEVWSSWWSFWVVLGVVWHHFWSSWVSFWGSWGVLGRSWEGLGASWGGLGSG